MKNSRSAILKRHNSILQKLNEREIILVDDIAKELKVSPLTVRRDFDELASKGLVTRFFGGIKYLDRKLRTDPASGESSDQEIKKRLIARRAAALVNEGDTILINSSTTAFYMFEFLSDMNITVITNNANAFRLADESRFELIFTGGQINTFKHSMVGTFAQNMLKNIRANKCFIGISGVSPSGALSTAVLQETTVNISMMNRTNEAIIVLADSSKIGIQHNFDIGSLDTVNSLVTDSALTEEQLSMLKKYKAEIIIADSRAV